MRQLLESFGPELVERYNLVLRLILAAALGGMIGLEREHSGKPAGFRTNMLICLGAALITEVSYAVARSAHIDWGSPADPARIAAQIVSGIGFLGAGTILHARGGVRGLTTAATLWVVAAIGMAVGAHAYLAAVISTGLVMLALMLLGRVEDHLIPRRPAERTVDVTIKPMVELVGMIERKLTGAGFVVDSVRIKKDADLLHASYHVRGLAEKWDEVIESMLETDGVEKIELS